MTKECSAARSTRSRRMPHTIRRHFPELIELYDGTASLQNRTVSTGILSPDLAMQYGAGEFVGRASARLFDARKTPGYAPYGNLAFDVPVRQAGDVDARVWVRIEEVQQSLSASLPMATLPRFYRTAQMGAAAPTWVTGKAEIHTIARRLR
jgi:NADH:ubiquinone oxidoreductase subunit D